LSRAGSAWPLRTVWDVLSPEQHKVETNYAARTNTSGVPAGDSAERGIFIDDDLTRILDRAGRSSPANDD
jgi:hypothetical protein